MTDDADRTHRRPRRSDADGAPGAMLVIISGPSGVGKDTIIDALRRGRHDPEYHYVITCTTRSLRPGEVDGVDYHFLDPETFAALRAAGEFLEANEVHGNWYGTPRDQVREALADGPRRHPQDRRPGRPGRQGEGPRGAPDLPDPAVARGPLPAPAQPSHRDRRRARAPPAQRRHRARAPGGLRLRRDQRDRARWSGRPSGSTRSSPTSTPATRPPGRGLLAVALTAARPRPTLEEASPTDLGSGRRASRVPSRSRSMRRGAAGDGRTRTSCPPALARPRARRGGAGRVRAAAGARDRRRRGQPRRRRRSQADRGPRPRRRTVAAGADPGPGPRDRGALPGAAGAGPARDAPAGPARTARAGRRADPDGAAVGDATPPALRRTRPPIARPPGAARRAARARSATWRGPDGRAGLLRRLRALAGGRRVSLDWTLLGCRRRAALRTLDPAAGRGTDGSRGPGRRGAAAGPAARAAPGWTSLAELAAAPAGELPAAELAGASRADRRSRGSSGAAWPRPRSASDRGARWPGGPSACVAAGPPRATCCPPRPRRSTGSWPPSRARDPRPLLLDGVTGGGKTAIYVEAIAASLEAGRPALVLVPEIALALPLVDRLRADLDARVALVHSGLGEGERSDEWRRIRAGEVDIVVGTRLAVVAPLADVGRRSSSTRSTTPPTRAIGRRGSRRATSRSGWPSWPVPRSCSARRHPRSRASVARASGDVRPDRPAGRVRSAPRRPSRSSTSAPSWPPGSVGCCRAR